MTISRCRPVVFTVAVIATLVSAGCSSTRRLYTVDREQGVPGQADIPGVANGLDWRIGERIENSHTTVDADGKPVSPPVDADKAVDIARTTLAKLVKNPADWKYAYCQLTGFQPGCYGWSVRFDRRGPFTEAKAGDGFVKLYVLMDGSVAVPTTVYER